MASSRPPSSRNTMSPQRGAAPSQGHHHAGTLSDSLNKLSLTQASRTPLPPSPSIRSPRPEPFRNISSPRPSPSPLRRSTSSMSIDRRASSPALLRKNSTTSLLGDPGSPGLGSRRSSSLLFGHPSSPLSVAMEEVEIATANTIAREHFGKELEGHVSEEAKVNTIVILHDDCYGHRFSRPKTNKGTLSMIVERPERIQASVMGISAAYVRLGERHSGGGYAPDPRRKPPEHLPFKIRKTARTLPLDSPAVTFVHGTKWMEELKMMCDSAGEKLATTAREVERPPKQKNEKDKPILHSGDLYLCKESLAAFEGALGGVCEGVDAVFEGTKSGNGPSQAFVCVRPPGHHCSSDFPSGFCWLNNLHVGIQHAVQAHGLTHAAIIDFDLHHGDGSQAITWAHNTKIAGMPKNTPNSKKTSIGYFSIHDINSYPCEMGDVEKVQMASLCVENAHGQSIWNVHLQPWKTEAEFWELYESRYLALVEKARSFLRHHTARLRAGLNQPPPKAAIFFSAGFDASEHESEGMQRHKVNVPTAFYARFTRDVVALAREEGTGVEGRVISVLEGGYSDKALISGVLSHISGLCHEDEVTVKQEPGVEDGLPNTLINSLSGLTTTEFGQHTYNPKLRYNSEWWHPSNLDTLVHLLNPTSIPPPIIQKKPRAGVYSSPTHASIMKQVDPTKLYRSVSSSHSLSPSRAASPPPPEVDWATAAQELCKLLIPSNRQIHSCTAADLAGTRPKKERLSSIGFEDAAPGPAGRAPSRAGVGTRQLRERSARAKEADVRSVSRTDRRKTIAANELAVDSAVDEEILPIEKMRRMSIGSTVSTASNATVRPTKPVVANGVQVKKTRTSTAAAPIARPASRASSVRPNPVVRVSSGRVAQTKAQIPSAEVPKTNCQVEGDVPKPGPTRLKLTVKSAEDKSAASKISGRKTPAPRATKAAPAARKPAVKGKVVSPPATAGASAPALTATAPLLAPDSNAVDSDSLASGMQGLGINRDAPVPHLPLVGADNMPQYNGQAFSELGTNVGNGNKPSNDPSSPPFQELSSPIAHTNGTFEHDPLSNPHQTWSAPQTDIKWTAPMTPGVALGGGQTNGNGKLTPVVAESQKMPPPQYSQPESQAPPQQQLLDQSQRPVTPRKAPVFTSNGFIPFSPTVRAVDTLVPSIEEPDVKIENESESDIWDVPATPRKTGM
ncbi:Arginase/deacetylase [Tothia fuscella]|uniref:Arginase/deacetylase n=1 Tax=Tothia fuscella TaxID=1048955 RepID=A0A9P4NWH9_9PEZI|nr:Arginase/deacetylase [Tothia fuscella]